MATKLDQKFVESVLFGVNALALEVVRLELLQEKKDNALKELMNAYERRIRSDCTTPECLESKPWRVHEYIRAEEALK